MDNRPDTATLGGGIIRRNKNIALALCVIFGWAGVHRVYVGKIKSGLLWLLTFGLFGFGWFADIIGIASGEFLDKYGDPLVDEPPWARRKLPDSVYLSPDVVADYGLTDEEAESKHLAGNTLAKLNEYAAICNTTCNLEEFVSRYAEMLEMLQDLMRLDKSLFSVPPSQDYHKLKSKYQTCLQEAIGRAVAATEEEINGEYSDSQEFQLYAITKLENSIRGVEHTLSQETRGVANAHIRRLKKSIGAYVEDVDHLTSADTLASIDAMDGHEFERWCAEALKNCGFVKVRVTPGSGDQGVDILAEKDGVKYAIQCKRYSSDLGNTPVQEVHLGKVFYKCHVGVVLTNQHFTTGAKEAAEASGVLLWDREWIKSYLAAHESSGTTSISRTAETYSDEMLPAAVDAILETGQASVSMLQRRLKLEYARAARIVDEMEELGIVGPFIGSKPRAILIAKSQWDNMRK